jgi:glycosyltransferase involved in cell wall biosynthesis
VSEYGAAQPLDVICFSHLRWDFVFQRPQQLMTRFARDRRVLFVEEPSVDTTTADDWVEIRPVSATLHVATPHLSRAASGARQSAAIQRALIDQAIDASGIERFVLWYWTPMALPFTQHLHPDLVVYDCMDELSGFAGAPPELLALEGHLLAHADVVFTGGHSLYEAKVTRHGKVYPFPSSVDVQHFARSRGSVGEPADQREIPHPRLGYFGVIDERLDLALVGGVARRRPDWHWVFLGPTAKIDPASVPRAENIHYLGMKAYSDLPDYLASWDVAVLPFAHNAATRFISPTKTPEYLAAGCAVVSTSIRDVVRPYGDEGLVHIADGVDDFIVGVERALAEDRATRLARVDRVLADASWDAVVREMSAVLVATAAHTGSHPIVAPHPPWDLMASAPTVHGASEQPQ